MQSEFTEITTNHFYGGVAQLGEHLPCKQGVMGSNPIISTSQLTLAHMFIENRIKKRNETDSCKGIRKGSLHEFIEKNLLI